MGSNILNGQASEWALLKRHHSEDNFGIQIAANQPEWAYKVARVIANETRSEFVDLNCGCPIDVLCNMGCGAALMNRPNKLCEVVSSMARGLPSRCITVKIRTGWDDKSPNAHKILPQLQKLNTNSKIDGRLAAVFIHGRSRLQRYSRLANWNYVLKCAKSQDPSLPLLNVIGNGDILSWTDWVEHRYPLTSTHDPLLSNSNFHTFLTS